MFHDVIEQLYKKIKNGVHFRDMEDLCSELADEFETIRESEKADYLSKVYEMEREKNTGRMAGFLKNLGVLDEKIASIKSRKIYPNEPCPCGSGKKYKKCCGRK